MSSAKSKKEKNTNNSLKDKNLKNSNSPDKSTGCDAREEDECSVCE